MIARVAAAAGWAVLAVVAAAWLALVEVFWLPLRIGAVPLPLSVLGAVVGNVVLVRLAHRLSGSRVVAVLPALVWLVIALAATVRRPEGDLVLVGTGVTGAVGLAFLGLGVVAAAFAGGRLLATPAPRPVPAGAGQRLDGRRRSGGKGAVRPAAGPPPTG